MFALGGDFLFGDGVTRYATVLLRQIVHGEVNAIQLTSWHRKIPSLSCSTGQNESIEIRAEFFNRDVEANVGVGL